MGYWDDDYSGPESDERRFPGYEQVHSVWVGSYEWAEMRFYKKDDRFFYARDAGCSCYGWDDNDKTEADLIELPTLESARKAYMEFAENAKWYDSEPAHWFDVKEKLYPLGLR